MIPYIAIAAGVTIGASILRCIFDELSSEEIERQEKIREKRKQADASYQKYKTGLEAFERSRLGQISQDEADYTAKMQREYYFEMQKVVAEYCDGLITSATQQRDEKQVLLAEIEDTIKSVKQAMKGQVTMLRRNSLRCLLRELEEAKEKVKAYSKYYLPHYIKNLEKRKSRGELEPPESFSFVLPENYFYTGKLIYMKKKDLLTDGTVKINSDESLRYKFSESDFIEDLPSECLVPVMCDDFLGAPDFARVLSARKGYFKNVIATNPKIGISATVTGYSDRKQIILDYNGCVELRLPRGNLSNEKRFPPIGATIRVYPINWSYNLYYPVEVSERTSDSYLCFSFDDLPIVFSPSQWKEFESKLKERDLLTSTGDWKIAPLNENNISSVDEVKLQLDNEVCFSAKIINDKKRIYFSYNGVLDNQYFVQPDDVFVGIDCVLNVYLDCDLELIDSDAHDNMANLVLMCLSEFKIQYQTKISHHGMQYFNKWAETTDKLITYLYKGNHTEVELDDIIKKPRLRGDVADYSLIVRNPDQLKEFVDSVYGEAKKARMVEFFFELSPGIQCFVSIKGDGSVLFASEDAALMDEFLNGRDIITLYQKSFPYAEIQQAHALHQFRVGKLINPLLQSYALDGRNIQSARTPKSLQLFNERIQEDSSQLKAIEDALAEKDIFLIQGPPGTGKTTVIREIILQVLSENPMTKILVVSQANVAVDNVLRGLLNRKDFAVDFVRCGHLEKIDPQIENQSFERIYNDYVDLIDEKTALAPDNALYQKWRDFVFSEGQYNPNVGELILKSKPIIGATCVGLAQKRIGLDRVVYDLVIIDEAGKALPAEILIPYIRGKKVILIGDHMQLPPTVHPALLDPEKIEIDDRDLYEDELFNNSFFYRMFTAAPASNKQMLSTQYRMPALIGNLVSSLFYNNDLKNGAGTDSKKPLFFSSNLTLINTDHPKYTETSEQGKSVTNPGEADLVVDLLCNIRESVQDARIAVITPYKGQKRIILRKIAENGKRDALKGVDVNTVDAFQGDEAEIVIFCCTRTRRQTNFFKDPRRINVAFSRAKNELIIIGSLRYFSSYDSTSVLPHVAEYIKKHGNVIDAFDLQGKKRAKIPAKANSPKKKSIQGVSSIPLSAICVPQDMKATPPRAAKVNAIMDYYQMHGELDKPVVVRKQGEVYTLVDKYLRYYVAEKLGFERIQAIILTE